MEVDMSNIEWCKMRFLKSVLAVSSSVFALAGAAPNANAITCPIHLCGAFTISVYQGTGSGASDPMEFANSTNPLLGGAALATGLFTGDINFIMPTSGSGQINDFLSSGGGTLAAALAALTQQMSSTPFA